MVDIHNKEAWQEILKWTSVRTSVSVLLSFELVGTIFVRRDSEPYLAKLKGKPGQLSPEARLRKFAGWILSSRFNQILIYLLYPPFPKLVILLEQHRATVRPTRLDRPPPTDG